MPEQKDEFKIPETGLKYKTYSFTLDNIEKSEKSDQQLGVFSGAMATEDRDRGNDIIASDAFDDSLKRYKKAKRSITLYYQHDVWGLPIGVIPIKSVEKDGKNWNVKGELNLDTQLGREVYSLMKQGALSDLSIGFTIVDHKYDADKAVTIIKKLELWEVSVVGEPMNPNAKITEVKRAELKKYNIEDVEDIKTQKEFEKILRDSGVFTRQAAICLGSLFKPSQSESDKKEGKILKVNRKLDELLNTLHKFKGEKSCQN